MAHTKMPSDTRRRMCTGKHRYATRALAEKAKKTCQRKYGHGMRVYPCPVCRGFHLSSTEVS